jgi:ADP-ribosyl-[dinitrogen reductase] hydrolase
VQSSRRSARARAGQGGGLLVTTFKRFKAPWSPWACFRQFAAASDTICRIRRSRACWRIAQSLPPDVSLGMHYQIRTSITHPLQIAQLRVADQPGVLGLTFCPGKKQPNALTGAWYRDLTLDLAAVKNWGATGVITLVTNDELHELQVPDLGDAVGALGMKWWHLPMPDMGVPEAETADRWREYVGGEVRAHLRRGDKRLVHCKGGLGRTGLLAAQILVEFGIRPRDAILQTRAARSGAIENAAQEAHVYHAEVQRRPEPVLLDKLRGTLLGGAIGNALAAPVGSQHWQDIISRHGSAGLHDFRQLPDVALVTDDTQMTMFTTEGLIRAKVRGDLRGGICNPPGAVHHAYLRWLLTQGHEPRFEIGKDGWLINVEELHRKIIAGQTCLSALQLAKHFGDLPENMSKGCGGVMRVAPCGFWFGDVAHRFSLGADCARLTHGHPTGYLAAGYFAAVIAGLADGRPLAQALDAADEVLSVQSEGPEVANAIACARELARLGPSRRMVTKLGQGWVAEEALAIAVYCVLAEPDPLRALALAVNHDGDSDTTGAIAGNLLGAMHGTGWIPAAWLEKLELRVEIERLATDFAWAMAGPLPVWDDYPGW